MFSLAILEDQTKSRNSECRLSYLCYRLATSSSAAGTWRQVELKAILKEMGVRSLAPVTPQHSQRALKRVPHQPGVLDFIPSTTCYFSTFPHRNRPKTLKSNKCDLAKLRLAVLGYKASFFTLTSLYFRVHRRCLLYRYRTVIDPGS